LPQLVIIPFVPWLMRRIDVRLLICVGLLVFAASCFMNLHLDTDYAAPQLLVPDVTRALGQALAMTPLATVAMVGIQKDEAGSASALFNMLRNLGGAIGTAALETFFTKREQYHSFIINAHVSILQAATRDRLALMQRYFMTHGIPDLAAAMHSAYVAVGAIVNAQATFLGYADCFGLLGGILLCAVITAAALRKGAGAGSGAH
jgi:DHA2 family multidrug resistance protein